MGPKFFQTVMGKRFIEGVVPQVLSELKKLNENLKRLNENLEKTDSDAGGEE
tara:strand:+ start:3195 stop:3350 length:156 start_codon:yes stop_codon:yes gene_type:complete